jgi:hypothetical protein
VKRFIVLGTILFVAVMAFRIAERLSPDALGMGLGVLFGVLAGIPTAILVLASARRREEDAEPGRANGRGHHYLGGHPYGALPQQPPVIILAGNGLPVQQHAQQPYHGYGVDGQPAWSGHHPGPPRQFRLVGETEGVIEDFSD